MRRCFAFVALCVAVGCGQGQGNQQQKGQPSHKEAEELAKTWVERNVEGKITFVQWGPHMTRKEVEALYEEGGSSPPVCPDVCIRVVFDTDAQPCRQDYIIPVKGKNVLLGPGVFFVLPHLRIANPHGDDWKLEYKKALMREMPAIK